MTSLPVFRQTFGYSTLLPSNQHVFLSNFIILIVASNEMSHLIFAHKSNDFKFKNVTFVKYNAES